MHGAEESMLRHLFPCFSCMQTVMDLHVAVFVVEDGKEQLFRSTSLQMKSVNRAIVVYSRKFDF